MAVHLINIVFSLNIPTSHKLVLLYLANMANKDTFICWPGIPRIALAAGVSERRVQSILRDLRGAGFIKIQRRPNQSNVFVFQPKLIKMAKADAEQAREDFRQARREELGLDPD